MTTTPAINPLVSMKHPDAAVTAEEFSTRRFDAGGVKALNVRAAANIIAGLNSKKQGSEAISGKDILAIRRKLEGGRTIKGLDAAQAKYLANNIDALETFLRRYGQWYRTDKTDETFCWSFPTNAVPDPQLRQCAETAAAAFTDDGTLRARHLKTAADLLGWNAQGEIIPPKKDIDHAALKKLEAAVASGDLDRNAFDIVAMFMQNGRPSILKWDKVMVNGNREFDLLYALPVADGKSLKDLSAQEKAALVAEYEDRFTHLGYDRVYIEFGDQLLLALNPSGSLGGKNG
ncbi:MAG: hypothetical protein MO852_17465, partial [Candidatus Devosia euplotis]|nr:hypothetical protein [Candidatus Devosia euplotis]